MPRTRSYSDEQLVDAVSRSRSWRGVLRELGLVATSSQAMRSVRVHADRLGADHSHFKGQRRWTDDDLGAAVAASTTWSEVAELLGVQTESAVSGLRGHAARLGVSYRHLTAPPSVPCGQPRPDVVHLDRAGTLLAASWFTLCGHDVSWPLEPSRYDLLVGTEAGIRRVQVKTTTVRAGETWKVYLSTSRRRRTYDPDEIDDFFIIDGSLTYYLIPVAVVGGLHAIHVGAYRRYQVAQVEPAAGT